MNEKVQSLRELTNLWLKDTNLYCNNCDADYFKGMPCCDKPQIGNNLQHTSSLVKTLKDIRETRYSATGATPSKNMRWGVSLPPRLYHLLEAYCRKNFGHKLFQTQKHMRNFMKEMPEFKVPEKI